MHLNEINVCVQACVICSAVIASVIVYVLVCMHVCVCACTVACWVGLYWAVCVIWTAPLRGSSWTRTERQRSVVISSKNIYITLQRSQKPVPLPSLRNHFCSPLVMITLICGSCCKEWIQNSMWVKSFEKKSLDSEYQKCAHILPDGISLLVQKSACSESKFTQV